MIDPDRIYRSKYVADLYGITEGTLRNWRVLEKGPKFIKEKGRGNKGYVGYPGSSLLAHQKEHLRSSTSDKGA